MADRKKILLVHFYSNGDCLYSTAVARQIKNDYPGSHLTWAIASNCKSIIANNPYVDDSIVIPYVHADDHSMMRQLKQQTEFAAYDHVFITHPSYIDNTPLYDGCIRSNVLNAYPHPITVPITPVLELTEPEKQKCAAFAKEQQLDAYKNVVLFEYAPMSGQVQITPEMAIAITEELVKSGDTAVILSSAKKVEHPDKAIVDGSLLTLRETAGLTHYCTLLLGCSSGITWLTTSSAAQLLPMVQILDPYAPYVNPISRDFQRYGLPVEKVIELFDFDRAKVVACVQEAMLDFSSARQKYNQPLPLHFKTTRWIIYYLLCYLRFGGIIRHIQVNRKVYGDDPRFYKEVIIGLIIAPFTLIKNVVQKQLLRRLKKS